MASKTLEELFRQHDIGQTGCLNKKEWIDLCAQDGINLSPDLAAALFDGLDTDSDGQVKISDIMKELMVYETTAERPVTPQSLSRRSSSLGPLTYSPSANQKSFDPRTPEVKERRRMSRRRSDRLNQSRITRPLSSSHLDGFNDPYVTLKETTEDGTEVISLHPAEYSPRHKKLLELETEISRSFPELLPTFNNVVEDFRTEILTSKKEKSALEENFLKEKENRKRDLIRLENELELQIERIEEKTKSEIHALIRGEYDSKIMSKEEEIAEIKEQVKRLKDRILERENEDMTVPDSTTGVRPGLNHHTPSSTKKLYKSADSDVDKTKLSEIMSKLARREAELATLKEQLELQDQQILLDKRELLNREEEKLQLYTQLQALRYALAQQEDGKLNASYIGTHSISPVHSGTESMRSIDENQSSLQRQTIDDVPKTPKAPERIYKVILVGDTGVGKSSFMHQFCDGVFYPCLRATVGVDFRTRNLRFDKNVYSIQLWDTAGQEKYRSIVRTYFRKVDGVIIMYDVTSPDTFHNVRSWMEQVVEFENEVKIPVIIVGNKTDLRSSCLTTSVSTEVGSRFAESHGVLFIETSIPTAQNVDETMRLLVSHMKLNEDTRLATVQLTEKPVNRPAKCCKF